MEESNNHVVLSRIFHAGIERVWDAFTTTDDILKWQSPVGMTTPRAEVDLKVGGTYAITMKYDDNDEEVTVRGVFKVIEPPTKLVYSWKWDGSEQETEVTFQFTAISESMTSLTLVHSGFAEIPSDIDTENNWTRESHTQGWTTAFDKLTKFISSQ